jgi:argininosuccinate synthase
MEKVAEPAFTPEDRIGALELQNLSVGDNRDLLLHHLTSLRALGPAGGDPLGRLLGEPEPDE